MVTFKKPYFGYQKGILTGHKFGSALEVKIDEEKFILMYPTEFMKSIIELEEERLEWSLKTFTEATPLSSLAKCKEELIEILCNICEGIKDPEEYADAIMCLFDSAGRDGISATDILIAYEKKIKINQSRVWRKNDDNTYSHIKS